MEIAEILNQLVVQRDQRRDTFASALKKAMTTRLGDCPDDVIKQLTERKIPRHLCQQATEIAKAQGSFTIFSLVDALTRLSQRAKYVGDRAELDCRIGALLRLAV